MSTGSRSDCLHSGQGQGIYDSTRIRTVVDRAEEGWGLKIVHGAPIYSAVNLTSGETLAYSVWVAEGFTDRLLGLIGCREPDTGDALLIERCRSVHTLFMAFEIDLVFLDESDRVVWLIKNLRPYRFSRFHSKAGAVLELPAGTIAATKTAIGDAIRLAAIDGPL